MGTEIRNGFENELDYEMYVDYIEQIIEDGINYSGEFYYGTTGCVFNNVDNVLESKRRA